MRFRRITEAVNHLNRCVHSRIKADRIFAAGNIVVDGAGDADAGNAGIRQVTCTAEGAVAANDHDAVNPQLTAFVGSLFHALRRVEFGAAGCIQHRSATMDDIGNRTEIHLF